MKYLISTKIDPKTLKVYVSIEDTADRVPGAFLIYSYGPKVRLRFVKLVLKVLTQLYDTTNKLAS